MHSIPARGLGPRVESRPRRVLSAGEKDQPAPENVESSKRTPANAALKWRFINNLVHLADVLKPVKTCHFGAGFAPETTRSASESVVPARFQPAARVPVLWCR
jgi:hypothetical protein